MENGNQLPRENQALLTEYQTCQQYNSAISTSYWTMTGIFIGFSSALLGGLIYGVISNPFLLQAILGKESRQIQNNENLFLGIITYVISIAIWLILFSLKKWLKRVRFLQQINFHRMRDIERDLGLWANWRIHGVDNLKDNKKDNKDKFDSNKIPVKEDRDRLSNYRPPGYEPDFWQYWRDKQRYERSSSFFYSLIFYTLLILWSLVWVVGIVFIFSYNYVAGIVALLLSILLLAIIAYCWRRKCKSPKEHHLDQ